MEQLQERATPGQINAARLSEDTREGYGPEWAPPVYGSYMATSTPAYRAVQLRSTAVRQAPLVAHRELSDGSLEPLPKSAKENILVRSVNQWWTAADLMMATEMYLSLWGSCFWYVDRGPSGNGDPRAIWPLRPDRVKIIPAKPMQGQPISDEYIRGFQYTVGNQKVPLLPDEVVWFRYINPMDEFAGLSPVAAGRQSLDMGRNALTFNSVFFKNGAVPGDMIFVVQGPIEDDDVDEFYKRLDARFANPANAHKPMLWDLSQGGEPKRLGMNQRDMEFMASLQWTVEDAGRIWGIRPELLMAQQNTTFNNMRESRIQFYISTVAPEWEFIASEVTEALSRMFKQPGLVYKFDTSRVIALMEARAEVDAAELAEVAAGTLTINEYRQARGREEVEWGDKPRSSGVPAMPQPAPAEDEPAEDEAPEEVEESMRVKSMSQITEAKALSVLARVSKALEDADSRFIAMQRRLFESQARSVLRNLRAVREPRNIGSYTTKAGPIGAIFDPDEWAGAFERAGKPITRNLVVQALTAHMAEFNLGVADTLAPSIGTFVEDRVAFWSTRVNAETAELLAQTLEAGIQSGEALPLLQSRVENVFAFNNAIRAERIARTEGLIANSQGHLEAYAQNRTVTQKMWLTAIDNRTRDGHINANRQVVDAEASFSVGGESLQAPGVGGSASNVVNCRCTVVPIIDTEAALGGPQGEVIDPLANVVRELGDKIDALAAAVGLT